MAFDRKLIFAIVMSMATLFVFHYFFRSDRPSYSDESVALQSGKFYELLSKEDIARHQKLAALVSRDIDFTDKDTRGKTPEKLTRVVTDKYRLDFSNYGGVLASVAYLSRTGEHGVPLNSVLHKEFDERTQSCFLLALEQKTPFFYELKSMRELEDRFEVVYQASCDDWSITKTYGVDKQLYKVSLTLDFEPMVQNPAPLQPRLLFPSPYVYPSTREETHGVYAGAEAKKAIIVPGNEINNPTPLPAIFGSQNRYFLHAMVGDLQHFGQMAYFKHHEGGLTAFLSGAPISKSERYELSFYMGPKDVKDLAAVDTRLESLLNFGMFSWLCKLLVSLLTVLYTLLSNYGLAIIALTLLIKIIFLPLSMKAAMVQEEQQKFAPQFARIRQKYSGDNARMMLELQRFHAENNISPAGPLISIFSVAIDVVVMIALYNILANYIALYKAPFFGWITDLSAKDPYFVLPALMGLSMYVQQRSTPVADYRMKAIGIFMTLVLTAVSTNFAAGLVLYWLVKNIVTIVEHRARRLFVARG